ncbi:SurA N-terminal domain-containing protein, partial [Peptostreptococcaceae bacterium OttesenSCG-928-C18]|nr:SurA N-terminal domain-containing protein [Peptostreptococcaceae bacterium OttesenSCG-928-C18]
MKKKIFKILSLGLLLSFVLTACSSKPKNVIAKVGKEYITAEEVNDYYNAVMAQQEMYMDPTDLDESTEEGKAYVNDLRSQIVETLIYEKTYVAIANKENIKVTDKEIDSALEDMIEQAGGEEALQAYLESVGQTEEEFNAEYKDALKIQKYITEVDEKLTEELTPSEKEVEKKLEESSKEYFPIYNADHILYSTIDDYGTEITDEVAREKIKAEAEETLSKINSGSLDFQAKFDEINTATESGEVPMTSGETQVRAEELSAFNSRDMVEEFGNAVSEMKKD